MRGIFLDSKPCREENSRSKHLVQFDDGSYSVLYSSNDIISKKVKNLAMMTATGNLMILVAF
ncbi:hypothetical protein CP994_19100 [Enterobacter hormaechei]|nr:hypothetical protein CP994_19100 [Enterobacter hormaechei]